MNSHTIIYCSRDTGKIQQIITKPKPKPTKPISKPQPKNYVITKGGTFVGRDILRYR